MTSAEVSRKRSAQAKRQARDDRGRFSSKAGSAVRYKRSRRDIQAKKATVRRSEQDMSQKRDEDMSQSKISFPATPYRRASPSSSAVKKSSTSTAKKKCSQDKGHRSTPPSVDDVYSRSAAVPKLALESSRTLDRTLVGIKINHKKELKNGKAPMAGEDKSQKKTPSGCGLLSQRKCSPVTAETKRSHVNDVGYSKQSNPHDYSKLSNHRATPSSFKRPKIIIELVSSSSDEENN